MTAGTRHRCGACDRVEWLKDGPLTTCRQFKPGGGCHDSRLVSGLKPLLPDTSFQETSSWAEVFTAPSLVGVVLQRLRSLADAEWGANVNRVVIGYPVTFETDESGDVALARLREAAQLAGFEQIAFCPEPIAAASSDSGSYEGKGTAICSVDFGGGTFDVAVLAFSDENEGESELLGLAGVPIGGDLLDGLLFESFVEQRLPVDRPVERRHAESKPLPATIRKGLKSLNGTTRLASDPHVYSTLKQYQAEAINPSLLDPIEDLIFGGQAYDFWATVEGAKRRLSEDETTRLVYRQGRVDVDVQLNRSEFERLLAPLMTDIRTCIEEALDQADLDPDAIDLVVRTGGSSQLPAFNGVLDDLFGVGKVEARPAYSSVASGLAEIGSRTDWTET